MKARRQFIKRSFERIDNSLKVLGLILASVLLTGFAVYLSSSFVRQVQQNQLNEAAQQFTQQLRLRLQSQEEQLLQYAASSPEDALRTFHSRAKRLIDKSPSIISIELRSEGAKLITHQDSNLTKDHWVKINAGQLPPAVMLNFLRATEQQKLYWAHTYETEQIHTAEAIVPTRVSKYVWVVHINTKDWLDQSSKIDIPIKLNVTLSEKPIPELDSDLFVSVPLGIAGTNTHLLFSRKSSAPNRSTLEHFDLQEVQGVSVFLALLGASLCLLLISYARDTQRYRKAREIIAKQETALLKQNQIGVMAEISTTLAHELNQPLATIVNYVAACEMLLKAKHEKDPTLESALESARKEAMRAGEIVQSIRNHLKRENKLTSIVSLTSRFEQLIPLIELLAKEKKTKLTYACEDDLFVQIDVTLLELVIINFCRNAIDAMSTLPLKRRLISLEISKANSASNSNQDTDQTWVQISVRDHGQGISQEVGEKLFTSFYTTKAQGMGIGLNLCHSVAESYGGRIEWSNNPDQGSTFKLILPLHSADNAAHAN